MALQQKKEKLIKKYLIEIIFKFIVVLIIRKIIKMNLSILCFTHATKVTGIKTHLVSYVVNDAIRKLKLKNPKVIILCDEDPDSKYFLNIAKFAKSQGWGFAASGGSGLGEAVDKAFSFVDSEFYLFLEHDWLFKHYLDGTFLLRIMNDNPNINYIRFNKRINDFIGWDSKLERTEFLTLNRDKSIILLKSNVWSNNPHIGRTKFFKNNCLPLVKKKQKSSWGVEESICSKMKEDISKHGFQEGHSRWGTYIYGNMGDGAVVDHLDGNTGKSRRIFFKSLMFPRL